MCGKCSKLKYLSNQCKFGQKTKNKIHVTSYLSSLKRYPNKSSTVSQFSSVWRGNSLHNCSCTLVHSVITKRLIVCLQRVLYIEAVFSTHTAWVFKECKKNSLGVMEKFPQIHCFYTFWTQCASGMKRSAFVFKYMYTSTNPSLPAYMTCTDCTCKIKVANCGFSLMFISWCNKKWKRVRFLWI